MRKLVLALLCVSAMTYALDEGFDPSADLRGFFKPDSPETSRELAKDRLLHFMTPGEILADFGLDSLGKANFKSPEWQTQLRKHLAHDEELLDYLWINLDEVYSAAPHSPRAQIAHLLRDHYGEKNFDLKGEERERLNAFWSKSYALFHALNFLENKYDNYQKWLKATKDEPAAAALVARVGELHHLVQTKFLEKSIDLIALFLPAEKIAFKTSMYVVDRFINVPDFDLGISGNSLFQTIRSAVKNDAFDEVIRGNAHYPHLVKSRRYAAAFSRIQKSKGLFPYAMRRILSQAMGDKSYQALYLPLESVIGRSLRLKLRFRSDDPSKNGDVIITDREREAMKAELKPGDILVNLANYFLMNKLLPGSWSHAWTYIGEFAELKNTFAHEEETNDFYRRKCRRLNLGCRGFFGYLEAAYPEAMETLANANYKDRFALDSLDARTDGIVLTSMHRSGQADHLLALRPKLPALEIALAIDQQFSRIGAPFDIDMDFVRSDRFACSELVRDSYRNPDGLKSLHFEDYYNRINILKAERINLPPSKIVQKFLDERGTHKAELEFVYWIEGDLKSRTAESYSRKKYGVRGPDHLYSGFEPPAK